MTPEEYVRARVESEGLPLDEPQVRRLAGVAAELQAQVALLAAFHEQAPQEIEEESG